MKYIKVKCIKLKYTKEKYIKGKYTKRKYMKRKYIKGTFMIVKTSYHCFNNMGEVNMLVCLLFQIKHSIIVISNNNGKKTIIHDYQWCKKEISSKIIMHNTKNKTILISFLVTYIFDTHIHMITHYSSAFSL